MMCLAMPLVTRSAVTRVSRRVCYEALIHPQPEFATDLSRQIVRVVASLFFDVVNSVLQSSSSWDMLLLNHR